MCFEIMAIESFTVGMLNFLCFTDRDEEEMNKREDKREGNKHCKERPSKDKVINTFLNNYI